MSKKEEGHDRRIVNLAQTQTAKVVVVTEWAVDFTITAGSQS